MVINWQLAMAIVSVVILFLFSIRKFSQEVQKLSGKRFKRLVHKVTSTPLRGTFIGAAVTSVVQSSSATTVILIGLVNAGLITFRNSLGVIIGANIGTTVTSQLIALNLISIAPFFIILGFFVHFSKKYNLIGKAIFYFGLIFFSLSLISSYLAPLSTNPEVLRIMSSFSNVFLAVLAGIIFTFLVQSSSITSGLVVVLASQGLLGLVPAIGVILGANIGTTTTALIASFGMERSAKKTAIEHFLFNVLGAIIILIVLLPFVSLVEYIGGSPEQQVANAHLIFNLSIAVIFLIFVNQFEAIVNKIYSWWSGFKR